MTTTPPKYWFPAKQYGWGWGLPNAWQGWAVLAGFGLLLAAAAFGVSTQVERSSLFRQHFGVNGFADRHLLP